MTTITSVPLEEELSGQLDTLAALLDQPKAWLIEQAIRQYLADQARQVQAIQEALDDYDSGNAELVPHEDVMQRLEAKIRARIAP